MNNPANIRKICPSQQNHSPALPDVYHMMMESFEHSSLSIVEQQVVLLIASRNNRNDHSLVAQSQRAIHYGVPNFVISAIQHDQTIADKKLEFLRHMTTRLMQTKGHIHLDDKRAFFGVGFNQQQLLDVILGISIKTLSDFSHLTTSE